MILVNIKYETNDFCIDMTVPENFVFKCRIQHEENIAEKENTIGGIYSFSSYIELSAKEIMGGWYPSDTMFSFKVEKGLTYNIPLQNLECKYVDVTKD